MMESKEILQILFSGCKFKYKSYDHVKAVDEFKTTEAYIEYKQPPDCFSMPAELKEKHTVWKVGKLRSIEFNPDGSFRRAKIGNKYSKTFYAADFGVNVKIQAN